MRAQKVFCAGLARLNVVSLFVFFLLVVLGLSANPQPQQHEEDELKTATTPAKQTCARARY